MGKKRGHSTVKLSSYLVTQYLVRQGDGELAIKQVRFSRSKCFPVTATQFLLEDARFLRRELYRFALPPPRIWYPLVLRAAKSFITSGMFVADNGMQAMCNEISNYEFENMEWGD